MASNDRQADCHQYTLRQLFSGDVSLVIPDLQRDYCWGRQGGDGGYGIDKASVVVETLVYLYLNRKATTLGLIYGYENPVGSNRLMIIDGQQRLSTLYLLLGMLYRRVPTDDLRRLLISDYELSDDREPRLVYQVRSEAMYFMSDLVTNFFLNRDGRLSQLEQSKWYFATYDSDSSIQSFIAAIRSIDRILEQASQQPGWDFENFTEFLIDKHRFLYHSLESRVEAENLFITLNTTGEPLTLSQSLKSLVMAIGADSDTVAERWEEMEHWAWTHRTDRAIERPSTSDALLDRFLRIWMVRREDVRFETFDSRQMAHLFSFFRRYKTLIEFIPEAAHCGDISNNDLFRLLPTLDYIKRWHLVETVTDEMRTHLRALWTMLSNVVRSQKITVSKKDIQAAVDMVAQMPTPDLVSLLDCPHLVSERLITQDEKVKLKLLSTAGTKRQSLNDMFERAQQHPLIIGNIHKVVNWATNHEGHFIYKRFNWFIDGFYQIWGTDIDCNPELDNVRRALLTLRSEHYPIVRRGETSLSLCWHDYDWQRLMQQAPKLIRVLVERVMMSHQPVKETLAIMADKFKDQTYPYYFLIKSPKALKRCDMRTLLRPSEPFIGYYMQYPDDPKRCVMSWFVEQDPVKINHNKWSTMRTYGARCLYTDHKEYNYTIDIYYTPDAKTKYRVEVFERHDLTSDTRKRCNVEASIMAAECRFSYHRAKKRFFATFIKSKVAMAVVAKILATEPIGMDSCL